jgi:hypothetical protein
MPCDRAAAELEAAVAFHEAGHAIVALALGSKVRVVEIAPRPHAHCAHRTPTNKAITALAGDLAEQRACPNSPWDADVDFQVACGVAEHLAPAAPLDALEAFRDRSQTLLDRHWREVEAVAGALLVYKSLTGDQVAGIIDSLSGPLLKNDAREARAAADDNSMGC